MFSCSLQYKSLGLGVIIIWQFGYLLLQLLQSDTTSLYAKCDVTQIRRMRSLYTDHIFFTRLSDSTFNGLTINVQMLLFDIIMLNIYISMWFCLWYPCWLILYKHNTIMAKHHATALKIVYIYLRLTLHAVSLIYIDGGLSFYSMHCI